MDCGLAFRVHLGAGLNAIASFEDMKFGEGHMWSPLLVVMNQQNRTVWKSLGGNGGGGLDDVQMVTGVAEQKL